MSAFTVVLTVDTDTVIKLSEDFDNYDVAHSKFKELTRGEAYAQTLHTVVSDPTHTDLDKFTLYPVDIIEMSDTGLSFGSIDTFAPNFIVDDSAYTTAEVSRLSYTYGTTVSTSFGRAYQHRYEYGLFSDVEHASSAAVECFVNLALDDAAEFLEKVGADRVGCWFAGLPDRNNCTTAAEFKEFIRAVPELFVLGREGIGVTLIGTSQRVQEDLGFVPTYCIKARI